MAPSPAPSLSTSPAPEALRLAFHAGKAHPTSVLTPSHQQSCQPTAAHAAHASDGLNMARLLACPTGIAEKGREVDLACSWQALMLSHHAFANVGNQQEIVRLGVQHWTLCSTALSIAGSTHGTCVAQALLAPSQPAWGTCRWHALD